MKKARIAELKNHLSRYLEYVRAGGSILVLDREQPIAHVVPLGAGTRPRRPGDDRLERLQRQGLIRRGGGGPPAWLGKRRPPRLRGSVLKDLLRERDSGR